MTKILLVEDDKSLREIYGVRLLAEGYDIVSAGDGEEALAMAIKEKPTLIISDVMMPKISGFDMLDILRSTTETRDIKVIMMTALSSDDQRSRGEQLGADRYLVKSQVGIEDVVRTVHEVLEDTPGTSGVPTPPAQAAPAADNSAAPAASDTPAPTTDNTNDTSDALASAATPGNEDAGPLPPQPTAVLPATESTLPQPTAPFSSPRPATLGERVIQPLGTATDTSSTDAVATDSDADNDTTVSAEAIAQELQASAEPVANSQVDEAISDADVSDNSVPANEPVDTAAAPTVTPGPFIPPAPSAVNLDTPVAPATDPLSPAEPVTAPAADLNTPAAPATSPSDSQDPTTPDSQNQPANPSL